MEKFLSELVVVARLVKGLDWIQVEGDAKKALGSRGVGAFFIVTGPLAGYETQRVFNAIVITEDNRIYDLVFGRDFFRSDYVSFASIWRVFLRSSTVLLETKPIVRLELYLMHSGGTTTQFIVEGDEKRLRELQAFADFVSNRLQKMGVI